MKNIRWMLEDPWYKLFNDITVDNYLPHESKYRKVYNETSIGIRNWSFKRTINENI